MIPLSLEEIRLAVGGRWLSEGRPSVVRSLTTDTRDASEGDLFVALRGPRFDGHDFLTQAAEAGCAAAVVSRDADLPEPLLKRFASGVIVVADTTKALGDLAAHHRRLAGASVIAVTGSNGKTTTKRMIHHILAKRLKGHCSPKSFNNAVGVPLTLLGIEENDRYVVCEIGSSAPGEIAALSALARPDVAVITSVSGTHLEKLGSVRGVAAEKASIVHRVPPDGLAVLCADSEPLAKALRRTNRRLVWFGRNERAQVRLTGHEPHGRSQRFEVNGHLWVDLPVPGRHNAVNALAAIAVAQQYGFSQAESAAALADFQTAEMRLEWIEAGEVTLINDAYNANPASVLAAAEVLAGCDGVRKVMIVGDMRELGTRARALHLQTGQDVAARAIDLLIGVGSLGRYIAMGGQDAQIETAQFDTLQAAVREVPSLLRRGDVVLIKGSRAMQMEQLIGPIRAAMGP